VKVLAAKLLKAGLVTPADVKRVEESSVSKQRHREASLQVEQAVRRLLEIDSDLLAEMTRWSNEHDIDIPAEVLVVWSSLDRIGLVHEWTRWCSAARETVNNQKEEL
jgi:hypothetical protein